jgi:hypothetical protein
MLITKRIEHAIDINDPITLNTDLENNVLNILRNMFVGRCFRGCFILSVNKLLNKSHCEINQDGLLHLATMSVIFEVSALVYLPGDVIVGCLVVNRQDDLIICKGPNASIIININQEKIKPWLLGIQIGQLIPVRVGRALYNPNAEAISINGVPFTFFEPEYYRIGTDKSATYDEFIAPIMAQIQLEQDRMTELQSKQRDKWDFFHKIMSRKSPGYKKGTDLAKLTAKVGEIVGRGASIDPARFEYEIVNDAAACVNLSFDDAALKLHNDHLKFIKMINDCVDAYDDAAVTSHENIWKMINKIKTL